MARVGLGPVLLLLWQKIRHHYLLFNRKKQFTNATMSTQIRITKRLYTVVTTMQADNKAK